MKNIVCSWQGPRCPPWAPRGGEILRGGGQGGKTHFHFLLLNQRVDFNQTRWGSSSGGRDQMLFIWSMWPPGGPGGGSPKGKWRNLCSKPKSLQPRYVVCVYLYTWRIYYLWQNLGYLFEREGVGKTQKHTLEPVSGFHPNIISSKLLRIILEKKPKFFVCSGGGGGALLLAKRRKDLNVLGNCIKRIHCDNWRASCSWGSCFIWIN